MTESICNHVLVLVIICARLSSSIAYDFYVGDKHGWNPNPCETFNNWAERARFQVNDKLVFNYEKDKDSVLEVSNEHYDTCNMTNPYAKLEGTGRSMFNLYRSGRFNFISGNYTRCMNDGEKLIVVVLANKHNDNSRSSHPLLPAPPVASPCSAPMSGAESPKIGKSPANSPSEDENSSHQSPHSSSAKLDLGLELVVAVLALGLSGGF